MRSFRLPSNRERNLLILSLFLFLGLAISSVFLYRLYFNRPTKITDASVEMSLEMGKYQGYSGTFINGRTVSLVENLITVRSNNELVSFEIKPKSKMAVSFAGGPILAFPVLDLAKININDIVWLKLTDDEKFAEQIVVFKK